MNAKKIQEIYKELFQETPKLFRAPARINLIGGHTDYNLGYALPMAINKHLFLAINPHDSGFDITAVNFEERVRFQLNNNAPDPLWAKYLHACLIALAQQGYPISGLRAVIGGTIPLGAGISSSAALTCGFLYAINDLFDLKLSLLEIAKLAQAAEHQLGVNCGIMDQYAILFSQKNKVLLLDCLNLSHTYFSTQLSDYQFILINSNVPHSLTESAYNDRVATCQSVLAYLKKQAPEVETLRDVSLSLLETHKTAFSELQYRRVRYVLLENERVLQAAKALEKGDNHLFGKTISQTHEGLRYEYEVSCKEIDFMIDFLKTIPSVLGARMIGGGFGGCILALVQADDIEIIYKKLATIYRKKFDYAPDLIRLHSDDGVRSL